MTKGIGHRPTPPAGLPPYRGEEVTPAGEENINAQRYAPPAGTVRELLALGRWFAQPRDMSYSLLARYFHSRNYKFGTVQGGYELNKYFLTPLRAVAGVGVYLHEFHSAVGHLGATFEFPDNAPHLTKDYDAWHDLILKAFFLEPLATSYPTAGETLARIWMHNMNYFGKATSHLRSVVTHPEASDHTRASALRVYGYTASFYPCCHPSVKEGMVDHIEYFQTHRSPLIATAAMFSLRTLSRI